jgi:dethiobiotin synthetase
MIFVTGTDTDIGKTLVSAILTLGTRGQYWKPIQAGTEPTTDSKWIKEISQLPDEHFLPERYVLKTPMSPHAAAEIDNVEIQLSELKVPAGTNGKPLIVEGAGGLMVPINSKYFVIDLIKQLACPAVLVSKSGLGTINHTLLSLDALRKAGIPIAGVIMNGPKHRSNKLALEKYGRVEVVAEIEPLAEINRKKLQETYDQKLKWFAEEFIKK